MPSPRHDVVAYLVFLSMLMWLIGAIIFPVGLTHFLRERIERGDATVMSMPQRGVGLRVECVSRLLVGTAAGNVTTPGSCNTAALGGAVRVCFPRGRADDVSVDCPYTRSRVLAVLVAGAVMVALPSLWLLSTMFSCGRVAHGPGHVPGNVPGNVPENVAMTIIERTDSARTACSRDGWPNV